MKKSISEKEISRFLKTLSKNKEGVVLKRQQIESILKFNLKILDYYIIRIEKERDKKTVGNEMNVLYCELNRKRNEILSSSTINK